MIQQHHKIYIDKRMVRPESLTQKQCRGPQTTVEHFLDPLLHSQRYLESCFVSPVVEDRAADKTCQPQVYREGNVTAVVFGRRHQCPLVWYLDDRRPL